MKNFIIFPALLSLFWCKNLMNRKEDIFDNIFIQQLKFGFWEKRFFMCRYSDPWIRIFLRIRIQKANMVRILNTDSWNPERDISIYINFSGIL